jgi:carbon monoxide dehydrogenase subunit G
MISIREEIGIATPPEVLWPILSDPAIVASCIPGAVLTKSGEDGTYQGTMRVKFGPTVAVFRGEAKLAYDHSARRCTIQGRGIDGRGASRANASGTVEANGGDTTLLKVEGHFNVTGPLETFANAGGVHLARAILAEFAGNIAKMMAEQAQPTAPGPDPVTSGGDRERAAMPPEDEKSVVPAASELKGGKILWRAFVSWLRDVFFGKRDAQ